MDYLNFGLVFLAVSVVIAVIYLVLRGVDIAVSRYLHFNKYLSFMFTVLLAGLIVDIFLVSGQFSCSKGAPPPLVSDGLIQLMKSKMASNIPDTMEVDKPYFATVRITRSLNDSVLLKGLDSSDRENLKIDTLSISPVVKVTLFDPTGENSTSLSGDNFIIKAINSEEQTVDSRTSREWKWRIVPQKGEDKSELDLRVSAVVLNQYGKESQDIPVFNKYIFVKTTISKTIWKFFKKNWEFFAAAIIIPLFLYGRNKFLKLRAKKKATPKPVGFRPNSDNQ